MADKSPNLNVVPVDDGVDTHEAGPAVIGRVEVRQMLSVRVGAPCPDEDCLDVWLVAQVRRKRGLHGGGIGSEGEVVGPC